MPVDVSNVALNALALSAAGEAPKGFRFTDDDRYVDTARPLANPFARFRR